MQLLVANVIMTETILRSRDHAVALILDRGDKTILGWIDRNCNDIQGRGCRTNPRCRKMRLGVLFDTLSRLGMFPRPQDIPANYSHCLPNSFPVTVPGAGKPGATPLSGMSIHHVFYILRLIDEKKRGLSPVADYIISIYGGGVCTACNDGMEKTKTSYLFPIEDLLCNLRWELQAAVYEATKYPLFSTVPVPTFTVGNVGAGGSLAGSAPSETPRVSVSASGGQPGATGVSGSGFNLQQPPKPKRARGNGVKKGKK